MPLCSWPDLWHLRAMLDDNAEFQLLLHAASKTPDYVKRRKRIVGQVREAVEQYGKVERGARWPMWPRRIARHLPKP